MLYFSTRDIKMAVNFNYKHLHYFWMVAHEGSIAKASEKLHITPQTISGQLSLLEDNIGNRLFTREGRGLRLTETGRLVLSYADEIFDLGRELGDVLRGNQLNLLSALPVRYQKRLFKKLSNPDFK